MIVAGFDFFVGDKTGGIADLMDDALLDFCLGINGFYRLWETRKPIDARNQDILYTLVL